MGAAWKHAWHAEHVLHSLHTHNRTLQLPVPASDTMIRMRETLLACCADCALAQQQGRQGRTSFSSAFTNRSDAFMDSAKFMAALNPQLIAFTCGCQPAQVESADKEGWGLRKLHHARDGTPDTAWSTAQGGIANCQVIRLTEDTCQGGMRGCARSCLRPCCTAISKPSNIQWCPKLPTLQNILADTPE